MAPCPQHWWGRGFPTGHTCPVSLCCFRGEPGTRTLSTLQDRAHSPLGRGGSQPLPLKHGQSVTLPTQWDSETMDSRTEDREGSSPGTLRCVIAPSFKQKWKLSCLSSRSRKNKVGHVNPQPLHSGLGPGSDPISPAPVPIRMRPMQSPASAPTTGHGMAWHGTEWHCTAQHSMAWHGWAGPRILCHRKGQCRVWPSGSGWHCPCRCLCGDTAHGTVTMWPEQIFRLSNQGAAGLED